MKLLLVLLTLAISFVLFPVSPYPSSAQSSENPVGRTDYGGEFDLNYCQYECRMRYGLEPSGMGGPGGLQSETGETDEGYQLHQGSTIYYQYANCLADCQKKFWQEFERKTGAGKTR